MAEPTACKRAKANAQSKTHAKKLPTHTVHRTAFSFTNRLPTFYKKIVFDFVPPYQEIPKYKALQAKQTKSPALAGRLKSEKEKEFLSWWCCLKIARTYFEQR